jgi:drug/metabolite transporter (DMT)-like permease
MTPLRRGFLWAVLAAVTFGLTTPLIAHMAHGVGTWFTAGWLYVGGALLAGGAFRNARDLAGGLRRRWPLLTVIGLVGGMLAPAAYVLGLRGAGAFATSLALNMEAPFSVAVAVLAFREHVSRRALAAMLAIVAGASLLTLGRGESGGVHLGVLLVILATALWAVDNALSSQASELDPRVIVFWKSAIGGVVSLIAGLLTGETPGHLVAIASLIAIGGVGYGASLLFYLLAQRTFGVARTASVFGVAPFIGAVAAMAAGDDRLTLASGAALLLMAAGVWLHVNERHAHDHRHEAIDHEHPHRHDDLHHDHVHETPVTGEHSHAHRHHALVHNHAHAPDREHQHAH